MSAMLPSHARTMEIVAIRLGLTFVIASQGGKAKTVKQVEEIFHFTRVKNVASFKFSINVPLISFTLQMQILMNVQKNLVKIMGRATTITVHTSVNV